MPQRSASGKFDEVLGAEYVTDKADILEDTGFPILDRTDAGRFLASVLERVEPEESEFSGANSEVRMSCGRPTTGRGWITTC